MNVGDPNSSGVSALAEGVGYARSSDDPRKGKNGSNEGALVSFKKLKVNKIVHLLH